VIIIPIIVRSHNHRNSRFLPEYLIEEQLIVGADHGAFHRRKEATRSVEETDHAGTVGLTTVLEQQDEQQTTDRGIIDRGSCSWSAQSCMARQVRV
jgi:hypothetical protein